MAQVGLCNLPSARELLLGLFVIHRWWDDHMWGTPMRDANDVSVERASVDDGAEIADLYLASRAMRCHFSVVFTQTMKCGVGFKPCYCAEARPGLLGWTDM